MSLFSEVLFYLPLVRVHSGANYLSFCNSCNNVNKLWHQKWKLSSEILPWGIFLVNIKKKKCIVCFNSSYKTYSNFKNLMNLKKSLTLELNENTFQWGEIYHNQGYSLQVGSPELSIFVTSILCRHIQGRSRTVAILLNPLSSRGMAASCKQASLPAVIAQTE